jgi:hypothetical protein
VIESTRISNPRTYKKSEEAKSIFDTNMMGFLQDIFKDGIGIKETLQRGEGIYK